MTGPSEQFNVKVQTELVRRVRRDARWRIEGRRLIPAVIVNAILRDFFESWEDQERWRYYQAELHRRHPQKEE